MPEPQTTGHGEWNFHAQAKESRMINRPNFLKDLKAAKGALSGDESAVPVYSMFYIYDSSVSAFNDILGIVVDLDEDTGIRAVVPGNLLISLLSGYSSDDLVMKMNGETVDVKCGKRMSAQLPTMPTEAWIWDGPNVDESKDPLVVLKLTDSIVEGIKNVMISMQTSDSDPAMNGVTIVGSDDGDILFYSTDRKTISEFRATEADTDSIEEPVTLPPLFCSQLIAIQSVYSENVVLSVYDDCAIVEFGKAAMFSRLMYSEATTDFQSVVEKSLGDQDLNLVPLPEGLKEALDRSMLFYKFGKVGMVTISVENKTMTVEAGEKGRKMKERFDLESAVDDITISVDPSEIKRALKCVTHFDLRTDDDRCMLFSDQKGFSYFVGRSSS